MVGLIPVKDMIPKSLTKVESWRRWRESLAEYLEAAIPVPKEAMAVVIKVVGKKQILMLNESSTQNADELKNAAVNICHAMSVDETLAAREDGSLYSLLKAQYRGRIGKGCAVG